MQVCVLGAAVARIDGAPVDLGGRKQRALIAALALHRGRPVSPDTLVDLLWADAAPPGAAGTLQGYVAGLRRALEPGRAARAPSRLLVTEPAGYALHVAADDLDAARFDSVVGAAHHLLGSPTVVATGGPRTHALTDADGLEVTLAGLDEALALWRGTPFSDLDDAPAAVAERIRLEELRLVALEDRAVIGLALGRHATVAAELESLTSTYPLRERLWALRAAALARSGRQADSLDTLRQVRELLADELGIEPGSELRDLQTAVLRQDPVLDWAPLPRQVRPDDAEPMMKPGASMLEERPPRPERRPVTAPSPWPMVGRTTELASLVDLLDRAETGTPCFAALVGEPGIGKSRLLSELAAEATSRQATVLVGRCSQDDGAPPLWPWAGVLAGLGRTLPSYADTEPLDEGSRFRTWDDIVRTVATAAETGTVVLLLDDLHWADVSSLRVLGLLLESVHSGRLLLVGSWRDRPAPTGALGTVVEQLSRRHALRVDLTGLSADEAGRVVAAVSEQTPSTVQADALRTRTEGNPFFLVEYARLAGADGDLGRLLAEDDPPRAVTDVVARRLERLEPAVRSVLTPAAVVGRRFELRTVARAAGTDEDTVLDALDAAVAAGLVREAGVDAFRFSHALVRDTVYAGTSPTRRARWHARVAAALDGAEGREGEVARHWQSAGPAHAGDAWRAGLRAGRAALRAHAFDEAIELLLAAQVSLADDPEASARDEYAVLVGFASAHKAAGDWISLRPVVHRALEAADRAGDEDLLARAALLTSTDALWQAAEHGHVDTVVVAALRRALARLPQHDHELRCRVMLALAGELYYGVTAQERDALAHEGLAMARRLGDPTLLLSACLQAYVSTWRPGTAAERVGLADEALALTDELGDDHARTYAETIRAVSAAELVDVDLLESLGAIARQHAEEQRNLYALVVLDTIDITWSAMRGEDTRARAQLTHLEQLGPRMGLSQHQDAVVGGYYSTWIWRGENEKIVELLRAMIATSVLPLDAPLLAFLVRAGHVDEARARLAEHEPDLGGDNWFSLLSWAFGAEAALELGDRALGARTYALLAPHVGQMTSSGSGVTVGPVDAFAAMAALATGETDLATRHADQAVELCRAWRLPLVEEWLLGQRERHGF